MLRACRQRPRRRRAEPRDELPPSHQLSPSTDRQLTAIKAACERTTNEPSPLPREQDLTGQIAELQAAGCAKIFSEKASGARGDRAELARVIKRLQPGDVLVVTRLDRLSRTILPEDDAPPPLEAEIHALGGEGELVAEVIRRHRTSELAASRAVLRRRRQKR
jgi:Resolvase, N terminal domain